jgi:hypothetical protein
LVEKLGRDSLNKSTVQSKIEKGKHLTIEKSNECFKLIINELEKLHEILSIENSKSKKKTAFRFQKYLISGIAWSIGGGES